VSPGTLLRALLYRVADPVLRRLGADPAALYAWFARRSKGDMVRRLRELRGLDAEPAPTPERNAR
jgi:hypothetical protein